MSESLRDAKQPAVLCDMCTEDRKPALKTCMKCEISMCAGHLQPHLKTPVLLQTHPLTEPVATGGAGFLGTSRCAQHGKLLEYYCLDDLTTVCVSCAIEDQHRLHNMKTFPTAHKELMEKLNAERQAIARLQKESLKLENWDKSQRKALEQSSVRLIDDVSKLCDKVLTRVQSSVSARMAALKTSSSSLQAAQGEKDTFRFLHMFSQVQRDVEKAKAADLTMGLEPGEDRDKLVQELQLGSAGLVKEATLLFNSLLTIVDPENHQDEFYRNARLTFNQQRLGVDMSLSEDRRTIYSKKDSKSSLPPECVLTILNDKPGTTPDRWLISLPKTYSWTIGFCDANSEINLNKGVVYGLSCHKNQLSYHNGCYGRTQIPRSPGENEAEGMARPEKVAVHWNFLSSSLSFFSIGSQSQKTKIISIDGCDNSQSMTPFVNLRNDEAKVSVSLGYVGSEQSLYGGGYGGHRTQYSTPEPRNPIIEVLCELL